MNKIYINKVYKLLKIYEESSWSDFKSYLFKLIIELDGKSNPSPELQQTITKLKGLNKQDELADNNKRNHDAMKSLIFGICGRLEREEKPTESKGE